MSQKPLEKMVDKLYAGRDQQTPDRKLRDAFEKYLALATKSDSRLIYDQSCRDDLYLLAAELLNDLQVSVEDAHGLLLERAISSGEKDFTGFFVSVVYNKSDLSEIVYDLDVEVHNLAYSLPEHKAFINKGSGHRGSGTKASGIIVNYVGNVKHISTGFAASGSIVTYGAQASTGYWIGNLDEGEDFIDSVSLEVSLDEILNIKGRYADPTINNDLSIKKDTYDESSKLVIKKEEIGNIPELHEYLTNLKSGFEQGKRDYRKAVETIRALGPRPNEKLKQDLVGILRRAGKNV